MTQEDTKKLIDEAKKKMLDIFKYNSDQIEQQLGRIENSLKQDKFQIQIKGLKSYIETIDESLSDLQEILKDWKYIEESEEPVDINIERDVKKFLGKKSSRKLSMSDMVHNIVSRMK